MTINFNLCENMFDAPTVLINGGPVYLTSNENVTESLVQMGQIRGRNILTVAASGDQALEAYRMGAAQVDTFDFNILQKYLMNFKLCAIKHLPYDKFITLFADGPNHMSQKIISGLEPYMNDDAKMFWDLFTTHKHHMIRTQNYDKNRLMGTFYATPSKYEQLRARLPENINFMHCDIHNLPNSTKNKYDIIILSNIFTYAFPGNSAESLGQMYNSVLAPLANNNLTDDGCIMVHYSWGFSYGDRKTTRWEATLDDINQKIIRNDHKMDLRFVDSYIPDSCCDAITVMRRVKQR